jgi:hypothetical protein
MHGADPSVFVLDPYGAAFRCSKLQGQQVFEHFLGWLRRQTKLAESRSPVAGKTFKVYNGGTGTAGFLKPFRLAAPGKSAQDAQGHFPFELSQGPAPEGFVSSTQGVHFEAVKVEKPRYGSTAHSAPPAMDEDGVGAGSFCRIHEGFHLRSEKVKAPSNGSLLAFFRKSYPHHFSFLVREQGKGNGPGYVCMGEFAR